MVAIRTMYVDANCTERLLEGGGRRTHSTAAVEVKDIGVVGTEENLVLAVDGKSIDGEEGDVDEVDEEIEEGEDEQVEGWRLQRASRGEEALQLSSVFSLQSLGPRGASEGKEKGEDSIPRLQIVLPGEKRVSSAKRRRRRGCFGGRGQRTTRRRALQSTPSTAIGVPT